MKTSLYILAGVLALAGCKNDKSVPESEQEELADNGPVTVETTVGPLELPAPFASESVTKESKIVAWPSGTTPT
ncbi:MAG: sorbosone dehydrogenase family protein, partial [Bacteroidota bacterium]|nr:sorbosone dehydrogenase family protein [Bacteroidota bacterium]